MTEHNFEMPSTPDVACVCLVGLMGTLRSPEADSQDQVRAREHISQIYAAFREDETVRATFRQNVHGLPRDIYFHQGRGG